MTCIYWRRSTLNMHWEHFAMWAGIRWRLKRKWYNHLCKTIFSTPPVQSHKDGVVIFSMIGTEVMTPYLVAAKSLHHHLKRGRMVIMDDGTLTDRDRSVLRQHLDNPRIISIRDIDTGPCPRGGTWERLLTILDLCADRSEEHTSELQSLMRISYAVF